MPAPKAKLSEVKSKENRTPPTPQSKPENSLDKPQKLIVEHNELSTAHYDIRQKVKELFGVSLEELTLAEVKKRIQKLAKRKDLPQLREMELFLEEYLGYVQEQYRKIASAEVDREIHPKGKITIEGIPKEIGGVKVKLPRLSWQERYADGSEKKEAKLFSEFALENREIIHRKTIYKKGR